MVNVIEAIEEKLMAQKDEIYFKDLQIKELKKQLEEARDIIKELERERVEEILQIKEGA